ncbi:MAG: hypothetical protein AAGA66_07630 [Bacteroidota bacterium]
MIRLYCLLLLSVFFASAHGQGFLKEAIPYQRNDQTVSLIFSGGYGGNFGFVAKGGFRYEYFLFDQLSLGVETVINANGRGYGEISMGPFLRYYLRTTPITPFIETRYSYGTILSRINDEVSYKSSGLFSVNGGLCYLNKSRTFGLELYYGYQQSIKNPALTGFTSGIRLNVILK